LRKVEVDSWTVQQFSAAHQDKSLDTSPEYQRRTVWKTNDKIFLLDSVARKLPIGAVTLFVDKSKGYDEYEVLDGKQRLTTILDYLQDDFAIKRAVVTKVTAEDEDERTDDDSAVTTYYDRLFSQLDHPDRMNILQYRIPVFIVEGDRKDAVFAFYRMNRTNYTLKPQEIRHAVFFGTYFLNLVHEIEEQLRNDLSDGQYFLPHIGVVSRQNLERMHDIQLFSELLILLLHGPQHRRDTIDSWYETYLDPTPTIRTDLHNKAERLKQICAQLFNIFGQTTMQTWHFPSNCENDYYALVGALDRHGPLTKPQLDDLGEELAIVVSEFRREVEKFVVDARERRQVEPEEYPTEVEAYGRTFLGGQINSKQRREERIRIIDELLTSVAETLDPQSHFTEMQRRVVWTRTADKSCARCGEEVSWKDYHAGHRIPHAKGGRTVTENAQIEHSWCNQAAGATS
jgi:hypothetical protein